MPTLFKRIIASFSVAERTTFLVAALLAAISGSVLSAILIQKVSTAVAAHGGEWREGAVGQPVYVNPVLAANEIDKSLVRLVFTSLGDAADVIEPSNRGRIWRVRLKDNVYWHDGKKLTSDDVVFTLQKIQEPDSRSPLAAAWQGVLVERVSEQVLEFNLGVPYAFFKMNLMNLYILPKHLYSDVPVANWRISDFNLRPVGSGPYVFDSFERESDGFITAYRLRANEKYFGERPYIARFEFKFFATKEKLLAAFNGGRIDGFPGLNVDEFALIERSYNTVSFALPNYYAIFINQNQNIALKEVGVRKALTGAIDKEKLVRTVFGAHARPVIGPLPPNVALSRNETLREDREAAIRILEDAGWKEGDQGIREKRVRNSTIRLEVTLTVPDVPFLLTTAQELEAAWRHLGVHTIINEIAREEVVGPVIKNRDYQMLLFGNILSAGSDLFSFWHSSERFYPGLNLSLYQRKEVDALIEAIRQSNDGEDIRTQYLALEELILGDYPAIFLYAPHYLYITGKDVQGIAPGFIAEPADRLAQAPSWYLRTKRILK